MSESNNIKFAEDNGKWLWKRYDEKGSVIHRSELFDTERQAREDYELNGEKNNGGPIPSDDTSADEVAPSTESEQSQETTPEGVTAPTESVDAGSTAPEGEVNAGTASPDGSQPGADQTV